MELKGKGGTFGVY